MLEIIRMLYTLSVSKASGNNKSFPPMGNDVLDLDVWHAKPAQADRRAVKWMTDKDDI